MEEPHTDYYSSNDHSSDSGEKVDHLKLDEPSLNSDSNEHDSTSL